MPASGLLWFNLLRYPPPNIRREHHQFFNSLDKDSLLRRDKAQLRCFLVLRNYCWFPFVMWCWFCSMSFQYYVNWSLHPTATPRNHPHLTAHTTRVHFTLISWDGYFCFCLYQSQICCGRLKCLPKFTNSYTGTPV